MIIRSGSRKKLFERILYRRTSCKRNSTLHALYNNEENARIYDMDILALSQTFPLSVLMVRAWNLWSPYNHVLPLQWQFHNHGRYEKAIAWSRRWFRDRGYRWVHPQGSILENSAMPLHIKALLFSTTQFKRHFETPFVFRLTLSSTSLIFSSISFHLSSRLLLKQIWGFHFTFPVGKQLKVLEYNTKGYDGEKERFSM